MDPFRAGIESSTFPTTPQGKIVFKKKDILIMCYITRASSFSSTSVWRGRECLGSSLAKIALGCSSSDSLSDGGSLIQASKSSLHTLTRLYFSSTNANDLWSDHIKLMPFTLQEQALSSGPWGPQGWALLQTKRWLLLLLLRPSVVVSGCILPAARCTRPENRREKEMEISKLQRGYIWVKVKKKNIKKKFYPFLDLQVGTLDKQW